MTPPRATSFDELVERASALATDPPRRSDRAGATGVADAAAGAAVLGIAGPPGAGKSTLAEALTDAVRRRLGPDAARLVPMDGFHLADVELERLGRRDRKGARDTFDAAGYADLLRRVRAGGRDTVYAPCFQRDLEQPVAGAIPVPPGTRLVLTEGLYLLADGPWARVRALLDRAWYVELDDEARTRRLVERHERFGKPPETARRWVERVDGANADVVRASSWRADLLVPGDVDLPGTRDPSR